MWPAQQASRSLLGERMSSSGKVLVVRSLESCKWIEISLKSIRSKSKGKEAKGGGAGGGGGAGEVRLEAGRTTSQEPDEQDAPSEDPAGSSTAPPRTRASAPAAGLGAGQSFGFTIPFRRKDLTLV